MKNKTIGMIVGGALIIGIATYFILMNNKSFLMNRIEKKLGLSANQLENQSVVQLKEILKKG
jgi:hypothetical protein